MENRRPSGLIIGSKFSGAIAFANDLGSLAPFFCPPKFEGRDLCSDSVLSTEGRLRYLKRFANAPSESFLFEASTYYAHRPLFEGVAERTASVLGSEISVIFVVRDPLERARLQLNREATRRNAAEDNTEVIFERNELLELGIMSISNYRYQLEPWLRTFGPGRVRIMKYEDWNEDRLGSVSALAKFFSPVAFANIKPYPFYRRGAAGKFIPHSKKCQITTHFDDGGNIGLTAKNSRWRLDGVSLADELAGVIFDYSVLLSDHANLVLAPAKKASDRRGAALGRLGEVHDLLGGQD